MTSASTDKAAVPPPRPAHARWTRAGGALPSFTGQTSRTRMSVGYRLSMMLAAAVMLVLPVVYVGIIIGLGWLMWISGSDRCAARSFAGVSAQDDGCACTRNCRAKFRPPPSQIAGRIDGSGVRTV